MGVVPIVTRSQLTDRRQAQDRRRYFAYTILNEFDAPLSEGDEALLDLIYCDLPGGPHNLKRTWRRRYAEVDALVCDEIARQFPGRATIWVHDMAASNAITSLDWYEALQDRFPDREIRLRASDLYDRVEIVSPSGTGWRVAFDADGTPVQLIGGRVVLPVKGKGRLVGGRAGRVFRWWLLRRVLPRAFAAKAAGRAVETISLYHPRVRATAAADPRFTLARHDLFRREDRTYDVVRLMSTVKTLKADRIEPLFRAISASVPEGGLLVAGQNRDRNRPEHIPTTVFRRTGNRFTPALDIMGGYDTRDLVLGLHLPPPAA